MGPTVATGLDATIGPALVSWFTLILLKGFGSMRLELFKLAELCSVGWPNETW